MTHVRINSSKLLKLRKLRAVLRSLPVLAIGGVAISALRPVEAAIHSASSTPAATPAAADGPSHGPPAANTPPLSSAGSLFHAAAAHAAGRTGRGTTGPVVDITPKSHTITGSGTPSIEVTVRMCVIWPYDWVIQSRTFTLTNDAGSGSVASYFSDITWQLGQPSECNGPNDMWEWWRGTIPLAPGNNVLTVTALDQGNYAGSDQVLYFVAIPERSVIVMADHQTVERQPGQQGTARFKVTNTGEGTTTYTIGGACGKSGSCGPASPSSASLSPGQTTVVTVPYTAPATAGSQITINFSATNSASGIPTVRDATWMDINAVAAPASGAVLALTGVGGSDVIERGLCLTASAGPDLAVECGELRATHPLPMVKTLNAPRMPVLIYNSEHAHPMPIVHADVTLPSGDPPGKLPVVNHRESPFGAGWWLAGVERIYGLGSEGFFWVGGDGSTRLYSPAATNVWLAANVDRADTLSFDGSSYYYRHLPNGEKVKFDATGLHVATINRLGYQTALTGRT
jgi:hypothetical protein